MTQRPANSFRSKFPSTPTVSALTIPEWQLKSPEKAESVLKSPERAKSIEESQPILANGPDLVNNAAEAPANEID